MATKAEKLDDPVWDYLLERSLEQYIPKIRAFWKTYADVPVHGTGVFECSDLFEDCPPGLMYRVTSSPVKSPIRNVQVFPFVPSAYLQLTGVSGGVVRMIQRVCMNGRFRLDEFTVIEKTNLPSTYHNGQILAFVPTERMEAQDDFGRWIYMNMYERQALAMGVIPKTLLDKLKLGSDQK